MFDTDRWQEIFHAMSKNKLRTALTAFGVFWGIFMLIVMMGSGKGLENGAKSDFGSQATNATYIWTNSTSKPYKGFPVDRYFRMDNSDIASIQNQVEGIELICPRSQLGGYKSENNVVRGKYVGSFAVYGDHPNIIKVDPKKIIAGRFMNEFDLQQKRKICVIGKRVQEMLFEPDEQPVGGYVRINGIYFLVVGVFDSMNPGGNNRDTENIFVPFTTFQLSFNRGDKIGWFCITANEDYLVSEVEKNVKQVLMANHDVAPDDFRAFGSWNAEEEFMEIKNLFIGINFLIWIVGIGTLLAGVIGVSNIMLIVVKERTKEIGIRKAIGAHPGSIVSQIILESTLLTAFSGYVGFVLAVAVIETLSSLMEGEGGMFQNPEINFNVAIIATVVLIISGALAGFIPAKRAASINPVIALRGE